MVRKAKYQGGCWALAKTSKCANRSVRAEMFSRRAGRKNSLGEGILLRRDLPLSSLKIHRSCFVAGKVPCGHRAYPASKHTVAASPDSAVSFGSPRRWALLRQFDWLGS